MTKGDKPDAKQADRERITRLAFIAGGEFMKDSIRRDRRGMVSNAGMSQLVMAASAYSREQSDKGR